MTSVDEGLEPLLANKDYTGNLPRQDVGRFESFRRFFKAPKAISPKLLLMLLFLLVSGVCNSVCFKVMTNSFYFKIDEQGNRIVYYTTFISQFTTFAFIPIFWFVVWYLNRIDPKAYEFPMWKYVVMATMDAVSGTLVVCGAMKTSGTLQQILGQVSIPLTMFFTFIASLSFFRFSRIRGLNARYKWSHYIGVVLIIIGIMFVFIPHTSNASVVIGTSPAYVLMYFIGFIPGCMSSVFKEICFKNFNLDIYLVNAWVITYQFLIGFPSLLFYSLVFDNPVAFIKTIPSSLWDGLKCFVGINTLAAEGITENICRSRMLWLHTLVYVIFNFFFNIAYLLIIKFGSATLVQISSALILPIADLCFTLPFIMNEFPPLPSSAVKCHNQTASVGDSYSDSHGILQSAIDALISPLSDSHASNNSSIECNPSVFNNYTEPLNLYSVGSLVIILLGMYFYQMKPEESSSKPATIEV